jgi:hypothetical protein
VEKPTVRTDRPHDMDARPLLSVDPATPRSTALQGDTRRDKEKRFYSPIFLPESHATNLRLCVPRRDSGPPTSAIRPRTPGFRGRVGTGRARTATDGLGGAVYRPSRSAPWALQPT